MKLQTLAVAVRNALIIATPLTLLSTQTFAADAETASQEEQMEVITVKTSYARSVNQSLNNRRYTNNYVDSIEAVDIGKFPANNVAEALEKVPGVAITRDRGEGVYVRVRGLGGEFQVTTVNGQTMAVNENVRNSGQTGRQFRYDTLPAELISGLEVIKSPTADLDEGAIGGVVNVKTFKPLDIGETVAKGTFEQSYAALANELDPRMSGLYNWVNDEKDFGVLVSAAYSQRSTRQDRVNEVKYTTGNEGSPHDGLSPTGFRPTLEEEDRERIGLSTALQWQPTSNLNVTAEILATHQSVAYDEQGLSMEWDAEDFTFDDDKRMSGGTDAASVQIGRETSGLIDKNISSKFGVDYTGDVWDLSLAAFVGRAKSFTDDPIRRTRLRTDNSIGMDVSFPEAGNGDIPDWEFTGGYDPMDPSQNPGRRLEYRTIDALDKEQAMQFDAKRSLDFDVFHTLKMGTKIRNRSRDYDRRDFQIYDGIEGVYFGDEFYEPFPVDDFLGEDDITWITPDEDMFWSLWDEDAALAQELTDEDKLNSYSVDETITSAYAMVDFDATLFNLPMRGNLGVRYVHTAQTSSGHETFKDDMGNDIVEAVSYDNSYSDVLPSFNAVVDLDTDMLVRFSAAQVMTRPDLADLSPKLTFNSSGQVLEGVAGNPELDPFRANQVDVAWEWYFNESSALMAGAFYKDITSFIQTQYEHRDYNGESYLIEKKVNGSEAMVKGLELSYQQMFTQLPYPYNGMGVQMNYTFTDSEALYIDGEDEIRDQLEGVAKNSFNITTFFEQDDWSLRLSYSWNDEIVNAVGMANQATTNTDSFGTLDMNVSYKINDKMSVYFNGMNLTGATEDWFVGDGHFGGYTNYGRTFSLGIRGTL